MRLYGVLHQGDKGVQIVVLFLDEQGVALFEEAGGEFIGDGEDDTLVGAEQRGNLIDTASGLAVEATAVVVAPLTDGAIGAGSLFFAVQGRKTGARRVVQAMLDVPDAVGIVRPVADKLHAGVEPAIGGDGDLPPAQLATLSFAASG